MVPKRAAKQSIVADKQLDLRPIVRAIEDNTREIKAASKAISKAVSTEVNTIHLAYMEPGDPRPTCWSNSGIGRKFTITNIPEMVTCWNCRKIMQENQ